MKGRKGKVDSNTISDEVVQGITPRSEYTYFLFEALPKEEARDGLLDIENGIQLVNATMEIEGYIREKGAQLFLRRIYSD